MAWKDINPGGGVGIRIEKLYGFLAVHGDGDEGLVGIKNGGVLLPAVAADRARLESLRHTVVEIGNELGMRVVLVEFSVRTDLEVVSEGRRPS